MYANATNPAAAAAYAKVANANATAVIANPKLGPLAHRNAVAAAKAAADAAADAAAAKPESAKPAAAKAKAKPESAKAKPAADAAKAKAAPQGTKAAKAAWYWPTKRADHTACSVHGVLHSAELAAGLPKAEQWRALWVDRGARVTMGTASARGKQQAAMLAALDAAGGTATLADLQQAHPVNKGGGYAAYMLFTMLRSGALRVK